MLRRSIAVLLVLGFPALPAADVVPLGGERVVAVAPDGDHYFYPPDSATRGSGFVVTWTTAFARYGASELIDWGAGVHGRRIDGAGQPMGGRLTLVPEADKIDISSSAVATDTAGRFAVVWDSAAEHHPNTFLWLRQFSALGTAVSTVRLDRLGPGFYTAPAAVAMGAFGRPLAVWGPPRQAPFASLAGLFGQLFLPTGQPLAPRFGVTARSVSASVPALGTDARGNAVLVYTGLENTGRATLYLRRYDRNGQPRSGEVRLAPAAGSPALSVRADGRFVVAWWAFGAIRARVFAPPYQPLGPTIEVNAGGIASPGAPDVAVGPDGRFLVAWAETVDGELHIVARGFDAEGEPLGETFRVDSDPPLASGYLDRGGPTVAASESGTFLVSWTGAVPDTGTYRILSRLYGMPPP